MAGAETKTSWPQLEHTGAVCYSGYRRGQSPATRKYPSEPEVLEDLKLLAPRFTHLRMYDCSPHVQMVLALIAKHRLPFKVMIGAYLAAESNNPKCPWGGVYDEDVLTRNRRENQVQLAKAISLANRYPDIVSSVSAGNEATVEWTDHLVPLEHVIQYVRTLKAGVKQPVTFCENYVPWQTFLEPLVAEVDFISVHTYPQWEAKGIDEALAYTEQNYQGVARRFPGKRVVITEAGWATQSNGRGIPRENANDAFQKQYFEALTAWAAKQRILTFVFEAFDEPWKGSDHPEEPEKHWGLYTVDRKPKAALAATR